MTVPSDAKRLAETPTPFAVVDGPAFDRNVATMAAALPGDKLRPHVKAHKCTAIAKRQKAAGHPGLCCATVREARGLAEAGLGDDILLANETLDAAGIAAVIAAGARFTIAVDSAETIDAAARGGATEVLIDVNVGLPRCGCLPERAGDLADAARKAGLTVRGVMGYEGHVVGNPDRDARTEQTRASMELLLQARDAVGGGLVSGGGTGNYDLNAWVDEIQAGSYVLMDTAYAGLGLPFEQALWIETTVISVSDGYSVVDAGLKALGMDHGNPAIADAEVWFCSDEHTTFADKAGRKVGDRVRIYPAHIDPTVAYHDALVVVDGENVVDQWPVDLRGW